MFKHITYQSNNYLILRTVLFSFLMVVFLAKPITQILISLASQDDMELCENDAEKEKDKEDDQVNECHSLDFKEGLVVKSLFRALSSLSYCNVLVSKDPQEVVTPPPEA